mgnify:CR=1 FL=1
MVGLFESVELCSEEVEVLRSGEVGGHSAVASSDLEFLRLRAAFAQTHASVERGHLPGESVFLPAQLELLLQEVLVVPPQEHTQGVVVFLALSLDSGRLVDLRRGQFLVHLLAREGSPDELGLLLDHVPARRRVFAEFVQVGEESEFGSVSQDLSQDDLLHVHSTHVGRERHDRHHTVRSRSHRLLHLVLETSKRSRLESHLRKELGERTTQTPHTNTRTQVTAERINDSLFVHVFLLTLFHIMTNLTL